MKNHRTKTRSHIFKLAQAGGVGLFLVAGLSGCSSEDKRPKTCEDKAMASLTPLSTLEECRAKYGYGKINYEEGAAPAIPVVPHETHTSGNNMLLWWMLLHNNNNYAHNNAANVVESKSTSWFSRSSTPSSTPSTSTPATKSSGFFSFSSHGSSSSSSGSHSSSSSSGG